MGQKKKKKIKKEGLEQLIGKMRALPPKEPSAFTARQAVTKAAPELTALKKQGYDWDDIISILSSSGITIKKNTLQLYLREAAKIEQKPAEIYSVTSKDSSQNKQPEKSKDKAAFIPDSLDDDFLEMSEDL